MKKYLDALKSIYIPKGDTQVSVFDFLMDEEDTVEDIFGVDSSSKAIGPKSDTIYVNNYFIEDLQNDINKRKLTKKRLGLLIEKFRRLFVAYEDGKLTRSNDREDLFIGDNGIEVRLERLEGDAPYRSLQTKSRNDAIILSHLFQHNLSKKAYNELLNNYDKELDYTKTLDIKEVENGVSKIKQDVINYFKQNNFQCDEDILNIILAYIEEHNITNINSIKYKLDALMKLDINGLEDTGFSPKDIRDEMKRIINENYTFKVTRELLTEANRQQLLQKSRNAQDYSPKNRLKGKNRYDRRTKSSISATVRDYNMIQMDPLFKRDILEFKIPVMGETDVYTVDVRVDGLLAEIRKQIMANKGTLEFKVVLQSLMKVLNIGNVYIGCNCPDARYRMAYQQTKNDYKAGYKETRPSDITNPNDTLGAGCKHVLLVLANLDWAVKVASVINNYIKYCKEHLQRNYADYIFPKIYGVKYDKAVQLQLFDNGLFPEDIETMNAVIDQGFRGKDKQGKFVKDNEFRFQKTNNQPEPEEDNPLGLEITSNTTETEVEEPEEQQ